MAQHPLLMFPSHTVGRRPDGPPRHSLLHLPSRSRQVESLAPKFDALRRAFEAERMAFQANQHGLDPEFVLVIETRGSIDKFKSAAQAIGMDWMGEIDLEDLEPDEDFWKPHDKTGARTDKHLDGRLYLSMTNQRAMEELLRLWAIYRKGQDPTTGKKKWRDLFDHAKDIRRWGARDRLRPEVLAAWREESEATTVPFRLELWFHPDGAAQETALRRAIKQVGGEVLAAARIEAIRFHALKGRIPQAVAQAAIDFADGPDDGEEHELAALFRHNEVHYFLPEAQGVVSLAAEAEPGPTADLPPPQDLEPVVALLDGRPLANHHWLDGRLRINDPDDTLSRYLPGEMSHGTAMASLILHDELDAHAPPLSRPLYCRPILEPNKNCAGQEHIPETAFAEDRVHRAVVEMFDGEAAPQVRIVNLSVGEEAFHDVLSPWARLIDWLAFKHRLLFCVSAGNQTDAIETGLTDAAFQALPEAGKVAVTLGYLSRTLTQRKLLSPGESINALTVGARHHDHSHIAHLANRVDLLPNVHLPSPVSRLGPGYRKAVKPDLLLSGGRQLYAYQGSQRYKRNSIGQPPGQRVAAPDASGTGDLGKTTHTRGTSNATALASRAAARFYDILQTLRLLPGGERIDRDTTAPLLKALLVHGASWPEQAEAIAKHIPVSNRKRAIARFYGYGIADPARVEVCTDQRATVLGCGMLTRDQAHEYRFPLPADLSGKREWRRLTITLAWLSPVNLQHRAYRMAKLFFSPPAEELGVARQQADWQQVQNGTVQHEMLEGKKTLAFQDGDDLRIRVSAQGDTQQLFEESIPYGLVVTLEVQEGNGLRIYQQVRDRLVVGVRADA